MFDAEKWLTKIAEQQSIRQIAKELDVSNETLSRQLRNRSLSFEMVLTAARHYGVNPVAALVTAGFLSADEASIPTLESALELASDAQLVLAVAKRIGVSPSMLFDATMTQAADAASNIVRGSFGTVGGAGEDDVDVKQPPTKKRTAAKKGTRKADDAPHAE